MYNAERGITLIALVITIIVLLILAGVSLSLVLGNNGIITRASSAVVENRKAKAREEVLMAWSSATSEYWEDRGTNLGKNPSDYYKKNVIDKYLAGTGHLVGEPKSKAEGGYTVKYKSDEDELVYIFEIDSNGGIVLAGSEQYIPPIQVSEIAKSPEEYYGKTVNYEANGITDWEIFYTNGTNIFLITSDYLPAEKIPAESGMTIRGKYQASWYPAPSELDTANRQDGLFMATGYTLNGNNSNSRCVSKLLNTGVWKNFVNDNYADYAIGSPTIEMWIASWNSKYPEDSLKYDVPTSESSSEEYGYKVDWETGNYDDNYIEAKEMSRKSGYNDELYFPHRESYEDCWAYWISSPYADEENRLVYVHCTGLLRSYWHSGSMGLRPVVSIKSTTGLINGTGEFDFDLE